MRVPFPAEYIRYHRKGMRPVCRSSNVARLLALHGYGKYSYPRSRHGPQQLQSYAFHTAPEEELHLYVKFFHLHGHGQNLFQQVPQVPSDIHPCVPAQSEQGQSDSGLDDRRKDYPQSDRPSELESLYRTLDNAEFPSGRKAIGKSPELRRSFLPWNADYDLPFSGQSKSSEISLSPIEHRGVSLPR